MDRSRTHTAMSAIGWKAVIGYDTLRLMDTMLRPIIVIIGSMLMSACATLGRSSSAGGEVTVTLGLDEGTGSSQKALSAIYTNVSNRPLCFGSDMFTNPASTSVGFWVRDTRGRNVASNEIQGWIPAPQPGVRRLEPGSSTAAKYNLYLRPRADETHKHFRARLRFQYYPCDADRRPGGALIRDLVSGDSGWLPL